MKKKIGLDDGERRCSVWEIWGKKYQEAKFSITEKYSSGIRKQSVF